MDIQTILQGVVILLAVAILVYLITDYYKKKSETIDEPFEDYEELNQEDVNEPVSTPQVVSDNVVQTMDSRPEPVKPSKATTFPRDCFPKDKLTPEDLLPKNAANSKWAQVNPAGQGDVKNQNFLTSGYHVGVNTVGTTLRNANMQIRSEPPNPQNKVSPWNQTTIQPDLNRKPLEINGCD
jgi:hypothetical protein